MSAAIANIKERLVSWLSVGYFICGAGCVVGPGNGCYNYNKLYDRFDELWVATESGLDKCGKFG